MTIALVQPSFEDFYSTPHRLSALGLHIIQAMIAQTGHESTLFLFAKEKSRTITTPSALHYLKKMIIEDEKGETAFFTRYKRFGPSTEEMVAKLTNPSFDLILISCFAYAYADSAVALIKALKQLNPDTTIAVGGAGATVNPSFFLTAGADAVLMGEAEESLPLFLHNTTLKGVVGANQPGTIQPMAMLAPIRKGQYAYSFLRGCRYRCKFCSQRLTHGINFRHASFEQMTDSFMWLAPTSEPIYINFEDDNLLDAKDLWFKLLDYLKTRYPGATFGAENGINYSQIDSETLDRLIGYGFRQFNLSLAVAGNQAKGQHRFFAPQQLEDLLQMIKQKKAQAVVYFIAGLQVMSPFETVDLLLYLSKLPARLGISPFYAVPGLEGFSLNELEQHEPIFFRSSSLYPWTKSHHPLELATAFRISRSINYLRSNPTTALSHQIIREKKLYSMQPKKAVEITSVSSTMVDYFFKNFELLPL